ncbi:DNA-binding transcriptional MerR regulator [Methylobacterium brachiatum]|jgi:hypothetical protein|uniref:DNA-binding transcriptional MerR regulator n=1 Tax=Methylobacterium brachiatum TaxID=269660 RepID=A0AAJ1TZ49_9HYPH|nr:MULTISPECIES: hypothetical protein [Methylobacterium]MCB4806470.1 hypothetical protein [Methylobacterium brachiatum]MDQ0547494.1 DNA-binding transcriptional MerR regulator [Methylobacterium brachiatum]WKV18898.1 DNA-binding transcriptional MerR regulator [Methylobacterium radiotolerans JCM 2831]
MPLDPKRLARDAKRAQAQRPDSTIGRETTGVTRAVRAGLPVIRQLRAAGVTWAAIAEALSAQGVTQGEGQPLTASRLTAIVTQVEAQERRKADREARRRTRPDLTASSEAVRSPEPPLPATAAPALPSPVGSNPRATEEEIRRAGLHDLHQLLKKS